MDLTLPLRRRQQRTAALLSAALLLLAGCSAVRAPGSGDGGVPAAPAAALPPASPPQPAPAAEAMPRVERIARGVPNAPYEVRGQSYDPENSDVPMVQSGLASWYGKPFHGRPTASGEVYDMHALTAAHKTMPLPSWARVRNPANGREIIVRINDRGPFKPNRIIDLSFAAAKRLRIGGVAPVHVTRLTHDEIRSGAWQRPAARASDDQRIVARAQ